MGAAILMEDLVDGLMATNRPVAALRLTLIPSTAEARSILRVRARSRFVEFLR